MKKTRAPKQKAESTTRTRSSAEAKTLDPRLAPIARAFVKDARVSTSGKGFGSGALRVNGKIFALISSRGAFVVKLPQTRVAELVEAGRGRYFDAGKGKPMKEWLALSDQETTWLALAKEAHAFVLAAARDK